MAGRKPRKDSKEDWQRFDKFKTENEQLRKEVTKLRKLVKETCIDSLNEKLKRQEKGLDPVKPLCEVCGNDDLHNVDVLRADGAFFFVICNNCGNRSSIKKKKEIKPKKVIDDENGI
jgi:hypothetical protein